MVNSKIQIKFTWSELPPQIPNMHPGEDEKALLLKTTTIVSTVTDLSVLCHPGIVRKKKNYSLWGRSLLVITLPITQGCYDTMMLTNTKMLYWKKKKTLNALVNLGKLNICILQEWNNLLLIIHRFISARIVSSM